MPRLRIGQMLPQQILQAADGDTVVVPDTRSLPGGAASWTSRIDVTVEITIKGQTTITGAGTSNPIINNNTVILDNSARQGTQSGLAQTVCRAIA